MAPCRGERAMKGEPTLYFLNKLLRRYAADYAICGLHDHTFVMQRLLFEHTPLGQLQTYRQFLFKFFYFFF